MLQKHKTDLSVLPKQNVGSVKNSLKIVNINYCILHNFFFMAICGFYPKADLAEMSKKLLWILTLSHDKWNLIPLNIQLFTAFLCNMHKNVALKSLDKQRCDNYNVKKLLNGYFCNYIVTECVQ